MFIKIDDPRFVVNKFVIYWFYEEKTCFCWNEKKLFIFPYEKGGISSTTSVQILKVPDNIKKLECFDQRVFVICIPSGVYKITKDREFVHLSKTGIGIGNTFFKVLIARNKHLCLDNKRNMKSIDLFQISSNNNIWNEICMYSLNEKNITTEFLKALTEVDTLDENICIIGHRKKLVKLLNDEVQIIYNCMHDIIDIVPIGSTNGIGGLILISNMDLLILVYGKQQKLIFEEICLGPQLQAICACFYQQDTVFIVYSDESKLYCAKKQLSTDNVKKRKIEDRSFSCLQFSDTKVILGITGHKQITEISLDITIQQMLLEETDTFVTLKSGMVEGTEALMDKIYNGAQELDLLHERLLMEKNKLRRINIFSQNQKLRTCPKMVVQRISNSLFLTTSFSDKFLKNSKAVLSLHSDKQTVFCMKEATDFKVTMNLQVPQDKMLNSPKIEIDLVTLTNMENPWCLIRDYVKDPPPEKSKRKQSKIDKSDFINVKIELLNKFISEGCDDMKILSKIKASIRKEFTDA